MKTEKNIHKRKSDKGVVFIGCEPGVIAFTSELINKIKADFFIPERHKCLISKNHHSDCIFYPDDIEFSTYAKCIVDNYKKAKFIICSSYHESVSKELLRLSKTLRLDIVFLIDHYSNLEKRLHINEKEFVIPNGFIVIDEMVRNELCKLYSVNKNNIFVMEHPKLRWDSAYSQKLTKEKVRKNRVLFISEEIEKDDRYYSELPFNEYIVFDDLHKICNELGLILDVKFHPMESSMKYPHLGKMNKIFKKDIPYFINNYDLVVGINSMLLNEICVYSTNVIFYQPVEQKYDCLRNSGSISVTRSYKDLYHQIKNIESLKQNLQKSLKYNTNTLRDFLKCA